MKSIALLPRFQVSFARGWVACSFSCFCLASRCCRVSHEICGNCSACDDERTSTCVTCCFFGSVLPRCPKKTSLLHSFDNILHVSDLKCLIWKALGQVVMMCAFPPPKHPPFTAPKSWFANVNPLSLVSEWNSRRKYGAGLKPHKYSQRQKPPLMHGAKGHSRVRTLLT